MQLARKPSQHARSSERRRSFPLGPALTGAGAAGQWRPTRVSSWRRRPGRSRCSTRAWTAARCRPRGQSWAGARPRARRSCCRQPSCARSIRCAPRGRRGSLRVAGCRVCSIPPGCAGRKLGGAAGRPRCVVGLPLSPATLPLAPAAAMTGRQSSEPGVPWAVDAAACQPACPPNTGLVKQRALRPGSPQRGLAAQASPAPRAGPAAHGDMQ